MKNPEFEAKVRPGEFELIAKLFAPLSRGVSGAFALTDDVAVIEPKPGCEFVLKTDSLIESVHFLRSDPAGTVAQKALRRALSDLAAKGAGPSVYLLALALPSWPELNWLEAFAAGLAEDQAKFECALAGGETNATPGPVTVTVTAVGYVPQGALIRRNGATPGDSVFVSGTIGDAGAGLDLLANGDIPASAAARDFLVSRYRLPIPRLELGRELRGLASAALDVSDGLLADLGHIAEASQARIEIDAARVPMSDALRELRGEGISVRVGAAIAGDDYEIAFTAPRSAADTILDVARRTGTQVTEIGRVVSGGGVALLDGSGNPIQMPRLGYTHFRA
ncbi:MAG TPA: thiamine-phosphate kinase [Rhizomicrobium sp.]|nr:thiamine-phosphate kinase [Rhizomicrobium sp.]